MPSRLKDRNRQIPYGFKFYLAEANWTAPQFASFTVICDGLQRVIQGNPRLAQKFNWPTDRASIEEWVDRYNSKLCEQFGWSDYIVGHGGGEPPKSLPPLQPSSRLVRLAAGANVLREMFGPQGKPVEQKLANARAQTCAQCRKNEPGDWTRFFTVPAQAIILKGLELVHDMKLETPYDESLGVCTACDCPLRGKVWAPLAHILEHIPPDSKAALWERCWIINEKA